MSALGVIYYFSGAYNQPLKRELNIDQLFSQYLERKLIVNTIKYKREHPEYTARIMVDSGAYTAYTKGVEIDVDDYIDFLNEWGDDIECFVGVDTVPDPRNVDYTYAQKTWDNYLYMYDKLRPEIRHKLIVVFHYGEDFKWLKNMLEYRHPDGSKLEYIGLAISTEDTAKLRVGWARQCRKIINESSNPDVKTHAFGVGVKSVLDHINVTSTDATSWVKRAAYGMISINDKTIYISDVQKEKLDGKHYTDKSLALQEEIENIIHERGFTVEELATDPYARAKFNILDTLSWCENLQPEETFISNVDLGW